MARWDWYQATVSDASPFKVSRALEKAFEGSETTPGHPKNGYLRGASIVRDGDTLAEVWWDGNPGVHVKSSGENSPAVCHALRAGRFLHRVTRADVCEDWKEKGLFDRLAETFQAFAVENNIKLNHLGDWHRGEARTLYLGARSSAAQLVLYEKGYQTGTDPTWVRLEARIYPKGERGYKVASWNPGEGFGATRWMTNLLHEIGWDHLQAQSIGTQRKPTDTERLRAALFRQYGPALEALISDLGGPDAPMGNILDAIEDHRHEAETLQRMIEEARA